MERELKRLQLDFKGKITDAGELEGYASVKNNIDFGWDVVEPGAYDLAELETVGWGAISHDWDELPVFIPMEAKEDEHGLWFKGKFHSTQAGQDLRTVITERLAAGKQISLSIGYYTIDASYETRDGKDVRVLKKISVVEISFVNMGMNPLAMVTGAKGHGRPLAQHVSDLLVDAEDLATRFSQIDSDRKQGLSPEYRSQAAKVVALFSPFAAEPQPEPEPEPEEAPSEADLAKIREIAMSLTI